MRSEGIETFIPTEISEFIEVFEKHLGDIRFPDVDRDKLTELVTAVSDRAGDLSRLNAQARAAREILEKAQTDLHRTAVRGLAYARVYAEGNAELSAVLAKLALGRDRSDEAPKKRSRGRPRGSKNGVSGRARADANPAQNANRSPHRGER